MTWSYSGDPSATDVDKYRFTIGDTDMTAPIMQDEEIQYIIDTSNGNENKLLYDLFSRAATLFARDVKRTLGPQSEDPTSRLEFYSRQAEYYKDRQNAAGLSLPVYGHEKVFHIGMNNNPPEPKPGT